MRFTDGMFTRNETGAATWGGGVLKSIPMPALPPSRRERAIRERANRAAVFATRMLSIEAQAPVLPAINRGKA